MNLCVLHICVPRQVILHAAICVCKLVSDSDVWSICSLGISGAGRFLPIIPNQDRKGEAPACYSGPQPNQQISEWQIYEWILPQVLMAEGFMKKKKKKGNGYNLCIDRKLVHASKMPWVFFDWRKYFADNFVISCSSADVSDAKHYPSPESGYSAARVRPLISCKRRRLIQPGMLQNLNRKVCGKCLIVGRQKSFQFGI